jgi:hypothetical protein
MAYVTVPPPVLLGTRRSLPLPDLANGRMAALARNVGSPEYGDFSG